MRPVKREAGRQLSREVRRTFSCTIGTFFLRADEPEAAEGAAGHQSNTTTNSEAMESTIERTQERLRDHFQVGIPFLVVTWLLVLLRLYVRGPMQKRLGLDDLYLCLTLVCSGRLMVW